MGSPRIPPGTPCPVLSLPSRDTPRQDSGCLSNSREPRQAWGDGNRSKAGSQAGARPVEGRARGALRDSGFRPAPPHQWRPLTGFPTGRGQGPRGLLRRTQEGPRLVSGQQAQGHAGVKALTGRGSLRAWPCVIPAHTRTHTRANMHAHTSTGGSGPSRQMTGWSQLSRPQPQPSGPPESTCPRRSCSPPRACTASAGRRPGGATRPQQQRPHRGPSRQCGNGPLRDQAGSGSGGQCRKGCPHPHSPFRETRFHRHG